MVTHSSILTWRIPWTKDPDGLQSTGSQIVGHNLRDLASKHAGCNYQKFSLQKTLLCCGKWLQSCPTLCDPMDHSLPGPSVHGILQARILEWIAMPFSRGSSGPRD